MEATLLLNASYEPVRIISWQRAVTLCFLGKVEVVEEYEREVRSVSVVVRMPSVVRLLRYVSLGRRRPPLTRLNLLARDNFQCQYCAKHLSYRESSFDHVRPRSQGGDTTWENVVAACHPCNRRKGGRTPKEARMALMAEPVEPAWLPVVSVRFEKRVPPSWLIFLGNSPNPEE